MGNVGIEYTAPGVMRFVDLGDPPLPGPRQVRIRTHYSGITNGTERHALLAEHGWVHFPSRHGYQHVGVIDAVGDQVSGFVPGDIVFYGQYVGHRAWHLVEVGPADPEHNGSHLCYPLPEEGDHEWYALLGVAGVAMRGVRRCRVEPAQRVWVLGAGLIGQFAAQAARAFGAHVTLTDVCLERLKRAQLCGADRVIDARLEDYPDRIKAGGPYDRIIDASGIPDLFEEIQQLGVLRHGGAIAALAVRRETRFDWSLLHGLEASIEVSCHFSLNDLRMVIFFLQQGIFRVEPLVTHRVPIQEAPRIYETLRDRPQDLLGVIFRWEH